MKTLKNNTLIYDQECPLCNTYTSYFIKAKLLDDSGRTPYNEETLVTYNHVDPEKARNQIALVDTASGKVTYGVESLVKVLSHQWQWIGKFCGISIVRKTLEQLYFFISYNRKVIAPTASKSGTCKPAVNFKYRWAYILFTWLIVSLILFKFSSAITSIVPESNFLRELAIAGGQVIFQSIILFTLNSKNKLEYLGNMMTVSFLASLMLTPIFIVNYFVSLPYLFIGYFGLVVLWMIKEHIRRVKILNESKVLTVTWLLYRLIILLIIIL